jgi:dTDP-4-dehydrorhamnose 3,5-epimerase-like enzyme
MYVKEIIKLNIQRLEQHLDDRGWLVEFVTASNIGTVAQVKVINFKKPHVKRGGHYHKLRKEWIACVLGKCEVKLTDIKTGEQKTFFLTKPNERLRVDPYVYHIFESKGESQCIVVVATDKEFEEEKPDTYNNTNKLNNRHPPLKV